MLYYINSYIYNLGKLHFPPLSIRSVSISPFIHKTDRNDLFYLLEMCNLLQPFIFLLNPNGT